MRHRKSKNIVKEARKVLHSVMLTTNVVIVILLIICGYAYMVSPENAFISPFLCYLFPLLALVNLIFFLYWLSRFKGWMLISVFGFLVTFGIHQAWFPVNFKHKVIPDKCISILTYNIMYMDYNKKKLDIPGELHPIIKYIRKTNADIVCLQEAGAPFVKNVLKDEKVKEALRDWPYISTGESEGKYSVICLSKFPILRARRIPYLSKSNSSYYYDLKIGDDTVRVINNHLESNKLNPKDKDKYTSMIRYRESDKLPEVAHIFGSKVGSATAIRSAQALAVSKVISNSPYKLIVCGDFNDVPGSYTYRTIRNGLKDCWIENGFGWGNTFHENFFLFRIDYILHSQGIESCNIKVDKVKYSDHYPLRANLVII